MIDALRTLWAIFRIRGGGSRRLTVDVFKGRQLCLERSFDLPRACLGELFFALRIRSDDAAVACLPIHSRAADGGRLQAGAHKSGTPVWRRWNRARVGVGMQSPRVRRASVTARSEQEEKGSFCDRYHTRTGGGQYYYQLGPAI